MSRLTTLSLRDRRALWIAALVLGPVIFSRAIMTPFHEALARTHEAQHRASELLEREQALVEAAPQLPAIAAAQHARLAAWRPLLFGGADSLAATAALATWTRTTLAESGINGAEVNAVGSDPVSDAVRGIAVEVTAQGSLAQLTRWLARIERSSRPVHVDELDISGGEGASALALRARVRSYATTLELPR